MAKTRRHYDATPAGHIVSQSLCGWLGGRGYTTTDPDAVDCRVCRRKLDAAEQREVEHARKFEGDYVDDTEFIAATREPLPVGRELSRSERALWQHVLDGVARIVAGENDRERARLPRETRFAGVRHALAELVVARNPFPSLSDPERMKRVSGAYGQGYSPPGPDHNIRRVEDLHPVEQAWRHAFDGDWDGGLIPERECREALLQRYVGGEGVRAIAERLTERLGWKIGEKAVGRATRWGFGRVWEHLADRELIPNVRNKEDSSMDSGRGQITDSDLFGWKEVAEFLGVSIDTAKRYARKGMPVRRFMGNVEAKTDELQQWRSEQTQQAG